MRRESGWALLARHLRPQRPALLRVALWSLVEALPALTSGWLVAAALDGGFLRGQPLAGLAWLGLLAVARLVGATGTRLLYPWLGAAVEPLRDRLVRDVVGASIGEATRAAGAGAREADTAGVARLSEQVEIVRQLTAALLRTMRQLAITVVASLVGLAALAPVAAGLVAPAVVVALGWYGLSLRRLAARQRAVVLAGEAVSRAGGGVLGGLRDVVACGAERRAAAEVGAHVDRQAAAERALARARVVQPLAVALGGQVPVVAVLAATPWLLDRGVGAGVVAGAVVYLTTSLEPALRALVHLAGTWGLQLGVTLQRLAECTAAPAPVHHPVRVPGAAPATSDLTCAGVTFAYGDGEPVVRALDLDLPEGERLAVVGPSGAGKSTLASLLAGLLRPRAGEVLLGGVPLGRLHQSVLRRRVALIPQEAYVFAGTLRDNLTYLRPGASDAELAAAAEALGLAPTVERLGGLAARLEPGGAGLSAGERQLVALARVYLSPAELVLLDEATCHLDPAAEARAEEAMATRPGTLVVIAHRISSALRARHILVLDGPTAQLGTHASLLATSPRYADLVGHWQAGRTPAPAPGPSATGR